MLYLPLELTATGVCWCIRQHFLYVTALDMWKISVNVKKQQKNYFQNHTKRFINVALPRKTKKNRKNIFDAQNGSKIILKWFWSKKKKIISWGNFFFLDFWDGIFFNFFTIFLWFSFLQFIFLPKIGKNTRLWKSMLLYQHEKKIEFFFWPSK